jgi:hypothetical protein
MTCRTYSVLVKWLEVRKRGYITRSQWHRRIEADSLTAACATALAQHTHRIYPSVSMCWLDWPGGTP